MSNKKTKNVILFQLSVMPKNPKINHYFYEEIEEGQNGTKIRFHFDGLSQLEPGTKYIISKLAKDNQKIDRIIALTTKESVEDNSVNYPNGNSSFLCYTDRIHSFLRKEKDIAEDPEEQISEDVKKTLSQYAPDFMVKLSDYIINGIRIEQKEWSDRIEKPDKTIVGIVEKGLTSVKEKIPFTKLSKISDYISMAVKATAERRFSDISAVENEEGYKKVEEDIKTEIDKDTIVKLDKLHERFSRYKKMIDGIDDKHKILKQKENRDIWVLYLLSKLSYYYKNTYYSLLDKTDAYEKQTDELEKYKQKAEKLEEKYNYYRNEIDKHIGEYVSTYVYYYCLLNDKMEYSDQETTAERKDKIKKLYDGSEPVIENVMMGENLNDTLLELNTKLKDLLDDNTEKINIFLDTQGGERSGIFVINSVLKLVNKEKIQIKEQFGTNYNFRNISNEIVDRTNNYDVDKLASGMNAFVNYGKADDLVDYLESLHENDQYSKNIVKCIRRIGDSISICDPNGFDQAIKELKEIIKKYKDSKQSQAKDNENAAKSAFPLLYEEIEREYEKILQEDKTVLDVIEWFTNKGFIQQALTYIESKMPYYIYEKILKYELGLKNNTAQLTEEKRVEALNGLGAQSYEKDEETILVNRSYEHYLKQFYGGRDNFKNGLFETIENEVKTRYLNGLKNQIKEQSFKDRFDYVTKNAVNLPLEFDRESDELAFYKNAITQKNWSKGKEYIQSVFSDGSKIYKNIKDSNNISIEEFIRYRQLMMELQRLELTKYIDGTENSVSDEDMIKMIRVAGEDSKLPSRTSSFFYDIYNAIDDSMLSGVNFKKSLICERDIDGNILGNGSTIYEFNGKKNKKTKNAQQYNLLISMRKIDGDQKKIVENADRFLQCHVAFRQERNSNNHASETEMRVPYHTLEKLIKDYIALARDISIE